MTPPPRRRRCRPLVVSRCCSMMPEGRPSLLSLSRKLGQHHAFFPADESRRAICRIHDPSLLAADRRPGLAARVVPPPSPVSSAARIVPPPSPGELHRRHTDSPGLPDPLCPTYPRASAAVASSSLY
ncbi:hypothetical protein NL676_020925 [Syzygium grande]|nr:hypothetical protein NL676_020925 [Syzygium grande]